MVMGTAGATNMGAYGRSVREFFRHLVLEEGKTIVLASAIVGIHRNTGSAWLRQFRTEELLRENERLRQADDDRKQGLDRARAENDSLKEQLDEAREKHIFLCRDNAELKATIRRLRPPSSAGACRAEMAWWCVGSRRR